jgi:hypothetical protein
MIAIAVAIARTGSAEPTSGWTGEGFELTDEAGDYRLRLGFLGSYKLEPFLVGETWQDREAFSSIQPWIGGSVYRRWIEWKTAVELAGNPPYLLDAYVNIARWEQLRVRVGQFRTPFSRSGMYGHDQLLFPDQAVVSSYFWTGRDKGAMAYGTLHDDLEYWLGVFGGSPLRQPTTISGNYVVEARLTYNPDGSVGKTQYPYIVGPEHEPAPFGISASLEGYVGKVESATETFDPSSFHFSVTPSGMVERFAGFGGDVFVQGPSYAIFAEGFYRRTEPEGLSAYRSWGVWGQASYLLVPETLDAGVRLDYLDPSIDLSDDTFAAVEAQLGWYIDGPRLVGRLRYGLGHQRSPGAAALGDVVLPVGFVGTANVFTAQLTLSI